MLPPPWHARLRSLNAASRQAERHAGGTVHPALDLAWLAPRPQRPWPLALHPSPAPPGSTSGTAGWAQGALGNGGYPLGHRQDGTSETVPEWPSACLAPR